MKQQSPHQQPSREQSPNKFSSRIGKLQDLIYQGVPDSEHLEFNQSDSDSDGGTVLYHDRERRSLQQAKEMMSQQRRSGPSLVQVRTPISLYRADRVRTGSQVSSSSRGQYGAVTVPATSSGMEIASAIDSSSALDEDISPRIDVIVDLEAPHSRGNLNKLLYKLYSESPYLRIFVNKWQEWDDFSHKDNPEVPRATFFPGCFKVFLERKLINSYNMYHEKQKAERRAKRNARMGETHTSFVESETRESVESQIEQFKSRQSVNKAQSSREGMFEEESEAGAEEDPFFNAEEIAFKVRLQCHKDRKHIVKKLVKNGEVEGGEEFQTPSPVKKPSSRSVNLKNHGGTRQPSKLNVLNEANEPEEEEDTYQIHSMRSSLLPPLHTKTEVGEIVLETVNEEKSKRRLQKQLSKSPMKKIEAINALYGSDATVDTIRQSLNLTRKMRQNQNTNDLEQLLDQERQTAESSRLPEISRRLISQENDPTSPILPTSPSPIIYDRNRGKRKSNSKVRFADEDDDDDSMQAASEARQSFADRVILQKEISEEQNALGLYAHGQFSYNTETSPVVQDNRRYDRLANTDGEPKARTKLSILEKSGIEVIRNGKVLNNDSLIQRIRVPSKIKRTFTVARDPVEQSKSVDRLSKKKEFVVSPIIHEKDDTGKPFLTKSGLNQKFHRVGATKRDEDGELNNLKVTNIQNKDMMLLTSQIFDIKLGEMSETQTKTKFQKEQQTQRSQKLSQSVQLPSKSIPKVVRNKLVPKIVLQEVSQGESSPEAQRSSSRKRLPSITNHKDRYNSNQRSSSRQKQNGMPDPRSARRAIQKRFDSTLAKYLEKHKKSQDSEKLTEEVEVVPPQHLASSSPTVPEGIEISTQTYASNIQREKMAGQRRLSNQRDDEPYPKSSPRTQQVHQPLPRDNSRSKMLYGIVKNRTDPQVDDVLMSPVKLSSDQNRTSSSKASSRRKDKPSDLANQPGLDQFLQKIQRTVKPSATMLKNTRGRVGQLSTRLPLPQNAIGLSSSRKKPAGVGAAVTSRTTGLQN